MRNFYRLFPAALLFALMCLAPPSFHAQSTYAQQDWLLRSMAPLGQNASFHTDFTFNRQMLAALGGISGDAATQRIVDRLDSVTVHLYRYPEPGLYDPAALEALGDQYRALGWMHLVATSGDHGGPPQHTDLWVHYEHGNVEGMTLLFAEPQSLNIVEVNGVLSPLDLLHLRGHFGIPRFSGDHFEGGAGPRAPVEGR